MFDSVFGEFPLLGLNSTGCAGASFGLSCNEIPMVNKNYLVLLVCLGRKMDLLKVASTQLLFLAIGWKQVSFVFCLVACLSRKLAAGLCLVRALTAFLQLLVR